MRGKLQLTTSDTYLCGGLLLRQEFPGSQSQKMHQRKIAEAMAYGLLEEQMLLGKPTEGGAPAFFITYTTSPSTSQVSSFNASAAVINDA